MKAVINEQANRFYEFGQFRIDTHKRILLSEGESVSILPKSFDALVVLVKNSGQVLDKDFLMKEVWPDSIVEENNLAQAISDIRHALGEGPKDQRYIVTVPRRGYRFAAIVREYADEETAPTAKELSQSTVPKREARGHEGKRAGEAAGSLLPAEVLAVRLGKYRWMVLAALSLAIGLSAIAYYIQTKRTESGIKVKSIAVLSFKPLVAESRDEILEMGMADTLVTKLGNIKELIVRPTSSVAKYSKPQQSLQDLLAAGRELKVDAVLDGHLQKSGDKIRVTAQLWSVEDGRQLWSHQFDESSTDVFAVEDSISRKIAEAVLPTLTGKEEQVLTKHYTENREAYKEYMLGRFLWNKRTEDGLRNGIRHFQQAINIDPRFALAYAGLADCYLILHEARPSQSLQKAKEIALEAVKIDDDLPESHCSMAKVKIWYEKDWTGAESEIAQAIKLNPNYSDAYLTRAIFLMLLGRFDEAYVANQSGAEFDPLSVRVNKQRAWISFFAAKYDQAIDQYTEVLEMDPTFPQARREIGLAYEQKGMYQEALTALRMALSLPGNYFRPTTEADIGHVYAVSGSRGEAQRILKDLIKKSEQSYVSPYDIAIIYAGLGENDQALEWLDKAYEDHSFFMAWLKIDPRLNNLRSDQRFITLLRKVGLG